MDGHDDFNMECAGNDGALDWSASVSLAMSARSANQERASETLALQSWPLLPAANLQISEFFGKFLARLKILGSASAENAPRSTPETWRNSVGRLNNALDSNKVDGYDKQICNQHMRRKKKTTIVSIEARERTTIRRGVRQLIAWCDQCGAHVPMVTPNEAAEL
ncbi:MAG TPA: hypothetical protein VE961_02245, partial [Pyrinomonadaceae bacterium]|nr:hypothetical protein [Pyrinomonadaceae bacterium]